MAEFATDAGATASPAADPSLSASRSMRVRGERLPAQIGAYKIIGLLGSSGAYQIYEAVDAQDRRVALKTLDAHADAAARHRMVREAQVLAKASHPNIVPVYAVGAAGEHGFIAIELVRGVDLRDWMATARPWQDVVELFLAVGRGLSALHAQDVVCGEFSPRKVVVTEDGRPCLIDLESARRPADLAEHTGLRGNPTYVAPEVLQRQPETASSDQFSFCLALFEALYGVRPYPDDSIPEQCAAKVRGQLRPPPDTRDVPAWLHRAVLRGLSARPEDRWPTLSDLLAALTGEPPTHASIAPRSAKVPTVPALVAAIVIAAALAGILLAS